MDRTGSLWTEIGLQYRCLEGWKNENHGVHFGNDRGAGTVMIHLEWKGQGSSAVCSFFYCTRICMDENGII